jgi:hypothetical protein
MEINLSSCKSVHDMAKRMEIIHSIVRDNNLHSSQTSVDYYNKRARDRIINEGDMVILKTHFLSDASRGFSSKLAPKQEGPFLVVAKLSDRTFTLKSLETGQTVNRVHINEISPFQDSSKNVREEEFRSIPTQSKKSPHSNAPILLPSDVSSRSGTLVSTNAYAPAEASEDSSAA